MPADDIGGHQRGRRPAPTQMTVKFAQPLKLETQKAPCEAVLESCTPRHRAGTPQESKRARTPCQPKPVSGSFVTKRATGETRGGKTHKDGRGVRPNHTLVLSESKPKALLKAPSQKQDNRTLDSPVEGGCLPKPKEMKPAPS